MRKSPLIAIALCFFLFGCANTSPHSTPRSTIPAQIQGSSCAVPPGTILEAETHGDLNICALPFGDIYDLRSAGENLVLFSGSSETTLIWVNMPQLVVCGSISLDFFLSSSDPSLVLFENGVSFYHPIDRQTLVVNCTGAITNRIAEPLGLSGVPILGSNQRTLFYCTNSAIRAWDLDSGVRRVVKEVGSQNIALTGVHFGDAVLQCQVTDSAGVGTLLLSSQTGQQLVNLPYAGFSMESRGEAYYIRFPAGHVQRLVFGNQGQQAVTLLPEDYCGSTFFLPDCQGAVNICSTGDSAYSMTYYDLKSGGKGPSIALNSDIPPKVAQTQDCNISFLIQIPESNTFSLCLWNTANEDQDFFGCYTGLYYPSGSPDVQGLDRCRKRAEKIGEAYGIEIFLGQEAVDTEPWDYHLVAEDSAMLLDRELTVLSQWLSLYPLEILRTTASHFDGFRICLVRQLSGKADGESLSEAAGLQFFREDKAYLALAVGEYAQQTLYHELFHAMETHLLTNTGALDRWNELNPTGFSYDYSYATNAVRNAGLYLRDGQQYFVDTYSMSFPKEDRARIMEYAMLPGNEELFSAPVLQAKLHALCTAIRDAYDLTDAAETFLWEQYLKK